MPVRPEPAAAARPLLVFPCNGNALEALGCLGDTWALEAFIDDTPDKQAEGCAGHPVRGREALARSPRAHVLAVPGSPHSYRERRALVEGLRVPDGRWATVVHPSASVSPLARLGRNVLVMAGVVVTANAVIGDHVCVLPNAVIHHDTVVGDWTLVGTGVTLAGHVQVGENCYLGSGTSVLQGVRIGDGALTGLGSTVIRHVPPGARVAGVPTRVLS
jgi:sugar O-acyltransferase (sialic acid O-acetyltransferase NeuD family)